MNRSIWTLGIATVMVAALSGAAVADDSRKGFVAGGGLGPGFVSLSFADSDRQNKYGLTTDITLGYGLNSRLIVYAMSRIVWFDLDGELTFSETAGVGVTYFLSEKAPSLFLTAGVGAAVFVQPGADTENLIGLGGLIGAGYEVRPHWLIEFDVAYNKPDEFTSTSLMAKLNYYYY